MLYKYKLLNSSINTGGDLNSTITNNLEHNLFIITVLCSRFYTWVQYSQTWFVKASPPCNVELVVHSKFTCSITITSKRLVILFTATNVNDLR